MDFPIFFYKVEKILVFAFRIEISSFEGTWLDLTTCDLDELTNDTAECDQAIKSAGEWRRNYEVAIENCPLFKKIAD